MLTGTVKIIAGNGTIHPVMLQFLLRLLGSGGEAGRIVRDWYVCHVYGWMSLRLHDSPQFCFKRSHVVWFADESGRGVAGDAFI